MCELCNAKAKSFGFVMGHWRVVQATQRGDYMKAGDWGLADRPDNDPRYWWPERYKPILSPSGKFGKRDDSRERVLDWRRVRNGILKNTDNLPGIPQEYNEPLWEFGFRSHGMDFVSWLIHNMALVIMRNPNGDVLGACPYDYDRG